MAKLLVSGDARLFSRELSWLAFNDRVLEEAADPTTPLLERVKYLAIMSTNLEEFFRVRFAALLRRRSEHGANALRDGMTVEDLIGRIRGWVYDQKARQAQVFDQICLELFNAGLFIEQAPSDLGRQVFEERIMPFLKPQAIALDKPLPRIEGGRLYMLARLKSGYHIIDIPPTVRRLWIVKTRHVFMVDRLIYAFKELLFSEDEVLDMFCFKVSRDAEMDLDEDAADPLRDLEEKILGRDHGTIVRLEVDAPLVNESVRWLQEILKVDIERTWQFSLPLDLKAFMLLYNIKSFKKLRYNFPEPQQPKILPKNLPAPKFFRTLDKHDILLHHPYTSFDPVVELVQKAAVDPAVTRICLTLYRTSSKSSPLLEALIGAAGRGKKVTALVEIKARFDEANNIRWARALEKAGIKVIHGPPDLKVHAKLTYVERGKGSHAKGYIHISTGNYHPRTARLYTDIGLMSSDPAHCHDARLLFNTVEKMDELDSWDQLRDPAHWASQFKTWVVSPFSYRDRIIALIMREAAHAREGKPAGIRAKMNGLVDEAVIEALYAASQAGVPIDLFVRGMCCLRPGVRHLSETIRVRSIVDKYLEHSRFFIFESGGERQVWLSSADWMQRNFDNRIEIALPLLNPEMRSYLTDTIWKAYDHDNARTRECSQDGFYNRLFPPIETPERFRVQFHFEGLSPPDFVRSPGPA